LKALEPDEILEWPSITCEAERQPRTWRTPSLGFIGGGRIVAAANIYDSDWASSVPGLVENIALMISERKKQELRFNLLHIAITEFDARVSRLERSQTRIVPINTFSPAPYELLKPLLVCVQPCEDGFEAGWFDVNVYTTGENEEESVGNLKSLILDSFEMLSSEDPDKLGPEPKRQIKIYKEFIEKMA
jgi:hypothetical protein